MTPSFRHAAAAVCSLAVLAAAPNAFAHGTSDPSGHRHHPHPTHRRHHPHPVHDAGARAVAAQLARVTRLTARAATVSSLSDDDRAALVTALRADADAIRADAAALNGDRVTRRKALRGAVVSAQVAQRQFSGVVAADVLATAVDDLNDTLADLEEQLAVAVEGGASLPDAGDALTDARDQLDAATQSTDDATSSLLGASPTLSAAQLRALRSTVNADLGAARDAIDTASADSDDISAALGG